MSDDRIQDEPIMAGSDEASDEQKESGRDRQAEADAAFYEGKDATNANQPEPDPARSAYVNPSSSDLSHPERDDDATE
ncbi:MAG: hypothetical protein Q7T71_14815 [Herbiconiux sp.]|nr:hypothetical protein [Herbiconiux sp.]